MFNFNKSSPENKEPKVSALEERVNALEQQNELLRVALDDIARMDPEGRIGWYAQQAIERADSRE